MYNFRADWVRVCAYSNCRMTRLFRILLSAPKNILLNKSKCRTNEVGWPSSLGVGCGIDILTA